MRYLYETHCHTKEVSACASASAEEQVRKFKAMGYSGIMITDHFFNGNTCIDRSKSWVEMCEDYCKGYENGKKVGDEIGMTVMFGIEYTYHGTDFLIYGLGKDWLKAHPEIMDIKVPELSRLVHADGGLFVHAHPFREADYIDTIRLFPHDVDAVEVYNAGNRSDAMNDRADQYANSYGLVKTSGSDAHHLSQEIHGGVVTEKPLAGIEDYIELVKANALKDILRHYRAPESKQIGG
ncbi:MAG: PHP domain-containing protein [Ruminococcus sp.]|nr:PHP domain-containing protein [Ruminococcus sp.]